MKNVLISGGSGLIGQELSKQLAYLGYTIKHLNRSVNKKNKYKSYIWSIEDNFIPKESLKDINIIIHLAGTPIDAKRWTKKQKKNFVKSCCRR